MSVDKEPEACPWCEWVDPDLWEYREGVTPTVCGNCLREIEVSVVMTVSYEVRNVR